MKLLAMAAGIGAAARVGAVAIAIAALYFVFVVRVVHTQRDALQSQAQAAEAKLRGGRRAASDEPPPSPAEQLSAFHASFPGVDASTALLRKIHAAAQSQGLDLVSGEYRVERRPGQALVRYVVTLPLTGTYKELRDFIAAVLADVPTAAIDDIQLRRESAASPAIEARVRLSLYMRAL